MFTLASLRSDWWTTWPELVDDFIGIRTCVIPPLVRMDSTPHLQKTKGKRLAARWSQRRWLKP